MTQSNVFIQKCHLNFSIGSSFIAIYISIKHLAEKYVQFLVKNWDRVVQLIRIQYG